MTAAGIVLRKEDNMKRSGIVSIIITCVILVAVIGGFAFYLGHKSRTSGEEVVESTAVQKVLQKDLERNYPPTPKEVVKYFAEITKCFYNEEYSDEDLEKLAVQIQELYDEELVANKSQEDYMQDLRSDIASMKENKYTIVGYDVSPSTDVEFFMQNEDSCARLYCNFYVKQGAGNVPSLEQFVLRKDTEGHWKIMGWDLVNE